MSDKLVNFRMDEDEYNELKLLALKERTTVKNLISSNLKEYIKNHKDGNPQYTIEKFQDENFMATPAFYRPLTTWEMYFRKADKEEKEKLKNQIIGIDRTLVKYL